jgi:acetyl-CoA C-acetyltransferase
MIRGSASGFGAGFRVAAQLAPVIAAPLTEITVGTRVLFQSPVIIRDIHQPLDTLYPNKAHGNPFGQQTIAHKYHRRNFPETISFPHPLVTGLSAPSIDRGTVSVYFSEMKRTSIPIIVGAAQYTQRKDTERPLDPLSLMVQTGRDAIGDTTKEAIKGLIGHVLVINLFQWPYRDAPGDLCARLGITAEKRSYLSVGGNTPQSSVNKASRDLAAGRCRAVLMAGAESIYSIRRALKGEIVLDWPVSSLPEFMEGDNTSGADDIEAAYDLLLPSHVYPLFETALRAASGRSPEEHQLYLGRLFAKLSETASSNSYAWSRKALSAEEIARPGIENRFVGYPYTRNMNANINVDQSAALVMTTEETARALGIPESKWVYPLGGADLNDIWFIIRRPRLDRSPAIRNASRIALKQAGLSLDDIGVFDFYSCFPSAFEIARKEVGIPEGDPRDLSVTGGLPFFGGPGNNYSMHAIATVVERIRKDRGLNAMVTANGWYLTKHSVGIYGGSPPSTPWGNRDDSAIQRSIDAEALPEPRAVAEGILTVEAYVIRHDTAGKPQTGTVIGRLSDGARALAEIDADVQGLLRMEEIELVGRKGRVRYDPGLGKNLIKLRV